ncbi:glycosyltransferase family 4 protein [Yinghuangia seranimata]|uniref:glycosyltransferase family 4 protein n=1 Tax=Yinghuangia seranimata TaxID=408067 RepID=UPI00248C4766|nr:glycosyltransferase family 4 protein [Yinghuangia seranimata]MDI2132269.1 glycosyltransferase family 4 protein [Yinghuangia seranimata]
MLVITSVATDTRVVREAATLAGAGYEVHVIGRGVPLDWVAPVGVTVSSVGGASVFQKAGAPVGGGRVLPVHLRAARWALLPQHRASAFAAWARAARGDAGDRAFDVVHAHDFNTLELGAELARERGVPLVYDTHELWSGRPRVGRPTPVRSVREARAEAELGRRAAAVLTVGQGIAEALRRRYGWPHVTVVHNSFPRGTAAEDVPLPTSPVGAVYAGRVAPYREIEAIVAAARQLPGLEISLVGPSDDTYVAALDRGPARLREALPVDEVDALLRRAGLALVTHSDRWENHRLAMPNKLFHAVRAGVPVVATDVRELARVVREHGLGTLYRPGDPESLAAAVREAIARYPELTDNVRAAEPLLSWEHDAEVLLGVYATLAEKPADPSAP